MVDRPSKASSATADSESNCENLEMIYESDIKSKANEVVNVPSHGYYPKLHGITAQNDEIAVSTAKGPSPNNNDTAGKIFALIAFSLCSATTAHR